MKIETQFVGYCSSVDSMWLFELIELSISLAPSVCFSRHWKMLSIGTATK